MGKGKLKNLFKKKEGGSVVGNLLRKVGDVATGGTYSALFPKPTSADIAKAVDNIPNAQVKYSATDNKISLAVEPQKESITKKAWFLPTAIGVGLGVIALIIKMIFKPKKRK